MTWTGPVKRVDGFNRYHKPTHWYEDANGKQLTGVTTAIDGFRPKPQLTRWAANEAAAYAVNEWDALADKPLTERLKDISGAPWNKRDKAAALGTDVHAHAERLIKGESVEVAPEQAGYVQACADFLRDFQVVEIASEFLCYDLEHGYAGTADLLAYIGDDVWLLDYKSGKSVYPEAALQLAAYKWATYGVYDAGLHPEEDDSDIKCAVVHLTANGYSLVEVDAGPETFAAFISGLTASRWDARAALLGQIKPKEGAKA